MLKKIAFIALLLISYFPFIPNSFADGKGPIFSKKFAEKIAKVESVMGFNSNYYPKFFDSPVDFVNVLYNMDFHFRTKLYTSFDSPYTTTPIHIAYDMHIGKNEIGEEVAPDYALLFVPGSAGSYFKYGEYMYDIDRLTNHKTAMFMMDPRGQGFSTWFNPKGAKDFNGLYVDDFANYINDLKYFYSFIVKSKVSILEAKYKKRIPIYIYGHSLGGGIVARYIELFPNDFQGAILSSPAIKALSWTTRNLAYWPIYAIVLHGGGPDYIPTGKSLHSPLGFDSMFCKTSCERRWYYWQKIQNSNFFNRKSLQHPNSGGEVLRMGYPTYWWTYQLIKGTNPIDEVENASKIKTPYIIFRAGMEDLVSNAAMKSLIENSSGIGKVYDFPSAKHDIMLEEDDIRNRSINLILQFMKRTSIKKNTFLNYLLYPFNYFYESIAN